MRTAPLEKRPPPPAAAPSPGADGLVRNLLNHLAVAPPPGLTDPAEGGAQILLDVELGGLRCVVMRVAPAGRPEVLLSPREREIARMVARGYPNKTIAGVLEISSWTVGTYLRRVFAKLGVCSRA